MYGGQENWGWGGNAQWNPPGHGWGMQHPHMPENKVNFCLFYKLIFLQEFLNIHILGLTLAKFLYFEKYDSENIRNWDIHTTFR